MGDFGVGIICPGSGKASIGTGGEKRLRGGQRKIGRSSGQRTTKRSLTTSGAVAEVTVRRADTTRVNCAAVADQLIVGNEAAHFAGAE